MARKPKVRMREQNRVIGYIRVSTDKQSDSGAGIEAQRRSIEQECERRNLELLSVVQDDGLSGKNLNRPGIQGALAELASGRADILMAAKLDRLSRSVRDFAELMDMSRSQGWILSVLDVAVDTSTPSGELMAGVMSQFAQFERRIIGQRTKDALAVKKAQGVVLGRRPEISADAEETIAQMRREGATMAAIADRLNADRVPTARGGAQWYPSTIQRVLSRAA